MQMIFFFLIFFLYHCFDIILIHGARMRKNKKKIPILGSLNSYFPSVYGQQRDPAALPPPPRELSRQPNRPHRRSLYLPPRRPLPFPLPSPCPSPKLHSDVSRVYMYTYYLAQKNQKSIELEMPLLSFFFFFSKHLPDDRDLHSRTLLNNNSNGFYYCTTSSTLFGCGGASG